VERALGEATGGAVPDILRSAAGARCIAAVRTWLGDRRDISDTAIGAWGASYTGGLILNALAAGVPLAAANILETWTDLYSAFWPQGVAKPLPVGGPDDGITSLRPVRVRCRQEPQPRGAAAVARGPLVLAQARTRADAGLPLSGPRRLLVRHSASDRGIHSLAGPKKLYVGAFGHIPSPGPARCPDAAYILGQSVAWFDRFLQGISNGIESPAVELVPTGGSRAGASWSALPPTRTLTFARSTRVATAFETWGGGTVEVQVRRLRAYPRLVAVVTAASTVVTHGAIKPHEGRNVIRLANYSVFVPKGARLRVTLGPYSKVDIAYPQIGGEAPGSISLGPARLKLSVLHRPVTG
jgi:hypothetical protein